MFCQHARMKTSDMRDLAAELVEEHGQAIRNIALRASAELACDGHHEGAHFWYALSLLLDDILQSRLDPDRPITVN
jgi:hypothetical protein